MTPLEFDSILGNWTRWAKSGAQQGNRCKSLEHRYKSPQSDHWSPPEPKTQIDVLSAERVEAVVVALPIKSRRLVVYHYLTPYVSIFVACRAAGVKVGNYDEQLRIAVNKLKNRLTF